MKNEVKLLMQKMLGYRNYLFLFSLFKIASLKIDKGERDFLKFVNLIDKDGVILDIGANIGLMSVTLARKFKKSVIYSFEPIPSNVEVLNSMKKFFGLSNIEVMPHALGKKDGKIEMVLPVVDSVKMQGLCHVVDRSIGKKSIGERFVVPMKKLDNVSEIKEHDRPIVGVKLDVEHFEWAVLKGAREVIEKYKPIIYCELADNLNRIRSLRILKKFNYTPFVVERGKLEKFNSSIHKSLNFIFIPE